MRKLGQIKKGEILEGEKLNIERMKHKLELWKKKGFEIKELEKRLKKYLKDE